MFFSSPHQMRTARMSATIRLVAEWETPDIIDENDA